MRDYMELLLQERRLLRPLRDAGEKEEKRGAEGREETEDGMTLSRLLELLEKKQSVWEKDLLQTEAAFQREPAYTAGKFFEAGSGRLPEMRQRQRGAQQMEDSLQALSDRLEREARRYSGAFEKF